MPGKASAQGSIKRIRIATGLRGRIVSGEFPPGSRLPTRVELQKAFHASPHTIQRALDLLKEQGFVDPKGRQGTFVVEHPPHLSRFALVMPCASAETGIWPHFCLAVHRGAKYLGTCTHCRYNVYDELALDGQGGQIHQLAADLRDDLLAGVVFGGSVKAVGRYGLLADPKVPKVALNSFWGAPDIMSVGTDTHSFIELGLDQLCRRGRRRLAVLTSVPGPDASEIEFLLRRAKECGIEVRSCWMHSLSHTHAAWAGSVIESVFGTSGDRPDALLIASDDLVPHATAALKDAGLRAPEDIDIVGLCHFPWPTPSALPIVRAGFDVLALLRACAELIIDVRKGGKDAKALRLPAILSDDLDDPLLVVSQSGSD